ncbi:branched-chain amino acid ABC transporter substrate-binding protein [Psychrobacillus sp. OK032]|uniref:branched-chain amino acid ABC transporter substrate-binding protein n=1 Tax=Psychrobacillus sp. OK032 TaxID=1884358 RepID=UPI0008CEB798|nr:branched-chain amino acid ABC transporter substrate-binding protein [Psychrobacillus sp. OK032]SER56760.1 branched-chain amino acid transport system substrate-binding protein [Psychrobacillus sp. OK032]
MRLKKSVVLLLSSVLSIGMLAACSSKSKGDESANGSNVIKIATQTPLSGGSAIVGESMRLGAQMKLEEQAEKFKELGYTLKLESYDDQSDPKKGVSNANIIGADNSIYAVVGHFNSGVTIPSSEVYEKYKVAMVSPGATAVTVTDRGLKTVNRIVGRDDAQGPAGAKYAIETLGAKKIFIIQDKTAYGSGIADAFKVAAEEAGAEIVGYEGITVGEKDFNGVINQVLTKNPDLIYFGGIYSEAGIIIKQARDKGIDVPIMGGDGMDASGLVDIAGDAVKNTYITSVAGDSTATEAGKKFVEDYKAKFNKNAEAFSVYGYDAMGVILHAIENAINENDGKIPSKEKVAEAVRSVKDYEGVLTNVTFNEIGDNTNSKIYLYKFNEASYPGILEGEVGK